MARPRYAAAEPSQAPSRFSRAAACAIVGLSTSDLERWERVMFAETGEPLAGAFAFADLLALAVLRATSRRLGERDIEFAGGLAQLFAVLRARPDAERLDDFTALIGRDFARLAELRHVHVRCADDDFVMIPLRQILADLRDQAFS